MSNMSELRMMLFTGCFWTSSEEWICAKFVSTRTGWEKQL